MRNFMNNLRNRMAQFMYGRYGLDRDFGTVYDDDRDGMFGDFAVFRSYACGTSFVLCGFDFTDLVVFPYVL